MSTAIAIERSATSLIGVDITPGAVELAQVFRGKGGEALRTARFSTLEASPSLASYAGRSPLEREFLRIAAVLRRRGFAGASIAIAAPIDRCVNTLMELPHKPGELPIPKLVRMELAREHRLDPADLESAWWELPSPLRSGGGKSVMSVGCPATILRETEQAAAAAGLHVAAIDSRSMALARGARPSALSQTPWQLVCDLSSSVPMVVVSSDSCVTIEYRASDVSIDGLLAAVAKDCRTDVATARSLCALTSLRQGRDRRSRSLTAPRVVKAMRREIDAVVSGVVQCRQYLHHRYGQAEGVPSIVVGEPWITARFLEAMAEQGDEHWTIASPGYGAARGLALWRGEVIP